MPRTKPLRLLLGLRLRDPAAAVRAAEAFLEEAASLQPRPPLAWNLPLAPLEGGRGRAAADLAVEIKTRVRSRSDTVLLMGYSGAPHPLLAAEELERELAWCRRNPWGVGAKGLLGQEPRHLLPVAADLQRERLDGVYGRHGFQSVGLAESVQRASARLGAREAFRARAGQTLLYTAWVLPAVWEAPALLAAAALAGRQPLFLLLEPADTAAPLLAPVLQALETRFQPQFLTLEQALAGETPEGADPPAADPLPLLCPAVLEAASRAQTLRARPRRRTDADLRAILEILGSSDSRLRAPAHPRDTRRKPEPALIAAMSGLVTLQGDGIAATFADGRLSGLQRAGNRLPEGRPAQSYLIAGGRELTLETESAFSFEQGADSGLRSVLKAGLAGGVVELVIQACFPEGQDELELGFRLRFPELPPELVLEAVVPFELSVFPLARGQRVEVTGENSGGRFLAAALGSEQDERLFTGSRFCLRKSGSGPALVFSSGVPTGVLILPVRMGRSRRGLSLLASPFGARFPAPARLYSGRTMSFQLRLGLED